MGFSCVLGLISLILGLTLSVACKSWLPPACLLFTSMILIQEYLDTHFTRFVLTIAICTGSVAHRLANGFGIGRAIASGIATLIGIYLGYYIFVLIKAIIIWVIHDPTAQSQKTRTPSS